MAQFVVTIPNAALQDVTDALASDWQAMLPGGTPNPITKAQHAKNMFAILLKQKVKDYKSKIVAKAAQDALVDPDITVS